MVTEQQDGITLQQRQQMQKHDHYRERAEEREAREREEREREEEEEEINIERPTRTEGGGAQANVAQQEQVEEYTAEDEAAGKLAGDIVQATDGRVNATEVDITKQKIGDSTTKYTGSVSESAVDRLQRQQRSRQEQSLAQTKDEFRSQVAEETAVREQDVTILEEETDSGVRLHADVPDDTQIDWIGGAKQLFTAPGEFEDTIRGRATRTWLQEEKQLSEGIEGAKTGAASGLETATNPPSPSVSFEGPGGDIAGLDFSFEQRDSDTTAATNPVATTTVLAGVGALTGAVGAYYATDGGTASGVGTSAEIGVPQETQFDVSELEATRQFESELAVGEEAGIQQDGVVVEDEELNVNELAIEEPVISSEIDVGDTTRSNVGIETAEQISRGLFEEEEATDPEITPRRNRELEEILRGPSEEVTIGRENQTPELPENYEPFVFPGSTVSEGIEEESGTVEQQPLAQETGVNVGQGLFSGLAPAVDTATQQAQGQMFGVQTQQSPVNYPEETAQEFEYPQEYGYGYQYESQNRSRKKPLPGFPFPDFGGDSVENDGGMFDTDATEVITEFGDPLGTADDYEPGEGVFSNF